MRRAITVAAVAAAIGGLAACSSDTSRTTLETDALAVSTAAARHDMAAATAALQRLRADVAAARRAGTIDATKAAAIETAAQRVLVDLRPAPTPAPSAAATPAHPPGGDGKGKGPKGDGPKGNGDAGGGDGGGGGHD